ncbi:MAG: DUF5010 domain-containing protein [Paludibacter sp.]|jgi:hypothetical protein|nr:DUF5010 domain-containing protein [Paludibacter sp.]
MRLSILFYILLFVAFLQNSSTLYSQQLGATFCWQYKELQGGHPYRFNQSIVKSTISEKEWWENQVEEVEYAGLDYIALLSRGTTPGRPDRGAGDPHHIPFLVEAMDTRGVNSFKLAIFDDCPNSWTSGLNYDKTGSIAHVELFDVGDPANYKYIWDYNLKIAIEKIPDERRYKIDGRFVIIFWSIKDTWMTNMGNGNIEKILQHIKTKCYETFGFYPYFVTMRSWFDRDASLYNSTLIDAVHDWFSSHNQYSWTNYSWTHRISRQVIKTGCCVPGFSSPDDEEGRRFLDPAMGTTDNSLRLKFGLDNTVKSGAALTLVEGFTDAAEFAALWRSTDNGQYRFYNYPSQRLNILRSYSRDPFPAMLKMEAEACDDYSDLTAGNSGGAYLQIGDLDVVKCTDLRGGWQVTATQAGEWLQWRDIPLLASSKFQLRYKSSDASSVRLEVEGFTLATTELPSTNGLWATKELAIFSAANNTTGSVRLIIVSGSPEINYLTRTASTAVPVESVSVSPTAYTLEKGDYHEFTATVFPVGASNKVVSWVTDNPKAATVNGEGKVTAVNPGTANIWAITHDGEKTASATITVTGPLFLDECDSLTGWSSSQPLTLNTSDHKQGTACIEFTGSTTDEFKKVFSPAFHSGTTVDNGALRFWYYVSDVTKCGPIRVELGSAGVADKNEYSWRLDGLSNGWNLVNLTMKSATKVGVCDLNAINWFRIYDSKSGSITTRIDAIEVYNTDYTAVDKLKFGDAAVTLFPNPVQDYLTISLGTNISNHVDVSIYDLNGKLVRNEILQHSDASGFQVDVQELSAGLYLLRIAADNQVVTKKLAIER